MRAVLLPMPLCDTLLRLAEEPAFYLPRWSRETLDEIHRNLIEKWEHSRERADRRIRAMRGAFEDAEVTGYESLIPVITNHQKDRHVLAAAVHCRAHAIVSNNAKDFPAEALAPYHIELMTADEFLVNQFHLDPDGVIEKLHAQAQKRRTTIMRICELLSDSSPGTPKFSKLVIESADC
jgi:predicted nucleic acid-binding protein